MSVKKSDYIKYKIYPNEMETYFNMIRNQNGRNFGDESYISEGGWVSRRSGRDIIGNSMNYSETTKNGTLTITITELRTNWREWIKTIGGFEEVPYSVKKHGKGITVQLSCSYLRNNPTFSKFFKQTFRKAAYCVGCRACEANCPHGRLKFADELQIINCAHCLKCHDVEDGCLAYNSLRIPTEEKAMSINCFDSVLPKDDWFVRFFKDKNKFWDRHGLGPNQVKTFKRFLKDAKLTVKNEFSPLANLINRIGWDTDTAWGIILSNLADTNPQLRWYISNFEIGRLYPRDTVLSMLSEVVSSKNVIKFIYSAYEKLMELPLGRNLSFGYVTDSGDLVRTTCRISDPRVILYALYKFAEKCGDYKEFTLNELLSDNIDRDGISPTRIFGLDRETMQPLLLGLDANYHDFITATFTNDLNKISLRNDKTSGDVLELFKEGK
jgi:phosphoadenosine phosphosulfate reductase